MFCSYDQARRSCMLSHFLKCVSQPKSRIGLGCKALHSQSSHARPILDVHKWDKCFAAISTIPIHPLSQPESRSKTQSFRGFVSHRGNVFNRAYSNGAVSNQESRSRTVENFPSAELIDALKKRGVNLPKMEELAVNTQHNSLICPFCEGGQSNDRSFSIKFEDPDLVLWNCFRGKCGEKGRHSLAEERRRASYPKPKQNEAQRLSEDWLQFFKQRGITRPVLDRNRIAMTSWNACMFRYFRDKEHVNTKYRTLDKKFSQVSGAEKTFFGYDDVKGKKEVIIVEGEMDKLAMEVAGYKNVASVPDGAPAKVSEMPAQLPDKKFEYVWNCWHALEDAERIILATDGDEPGQCLAEELARRLGKGRCWKLDWKHVNTVPIQYAQQVQPNQPVQTPIKVPLVNPPNLHSRLQIIRRQQPHRRSEIPINNNNVYSPQPVPIQTQYPPSSIPILPKNPSVECKDANAVLLARGVEGIQACVRAAKPYPVPEIIRFSDLASSNPNFEQYLPLQADVTRPQLWPNLDPFFQIQPGNVTLVYGPIMSGKSEFTQAMLCNYARSMDRKSAFCLLDQQDASVIKDSLEAKLGSMGQQQAQMKLLRLKFLEDHFCLLQGDNGLASSLENLFKILQVANFRSKLDVVLIDSLQSVRPFPDTVEKCRTLVQGLKDYATKENLHILLTAHTLNPGECDGLLAACDTGLRIFRHNQEISVSVHANNKKVSRPGEAQFSFEQHTRMYWPRALPK